MVRACVVKRIDSHYTDANRIYLTWFSKIILGHWVDAVLLYSALQRLKVSLRPMAAQSKRAPTGRRTANHAALLRVLCLVGEFGKCPETSVGARLPAKWPVCPVEMQRVEVSLRGQARSYGCCVWLENSGMP